MRQEQLLLLLNEFRNLNAPISAQDCAKLLHISISSLKKDIRSMKPLLEKNGCKIDGKTGYGNGYELTVFDETKFTHFLHEDLPKEVELYQENYNDQKNRIRFIIHSLLNADEYIKSDDLAERLCISKSQFSKDFALVKDYFKNYHIALINKPHYGIKIEADEVSIRTCFANTYMNHIDFSEDHRVYVQPDTEKEEELSTIRSIVITSSKHYHYQLTDLSIQNLVVHLFIAVKRVESQKKVTLQEDIRELLLKEKEVTLAKEIIAKMEEAFDVSFDDEEVCYIVMHLSAKRMADSDEALNGEIMQLIDEMLLRIREKFCIDLFGNLDLRITLGLHTIPLLKRIKYHLVFKNPLLEEIKTNLVFAYDLALCACEALNEAYDCCLPPDEVGYFALHFKAAMDSSKLVQKKCILLVCSSGRGSAQLLKTELLSKFQEQIEHVDTCNVFELTEKDLSLFDCVFTTVPIFVRLPIPVFKIKYFLDAETQKQVSKVLQTKHQVHKLITYFDEDLFHVNVEASTKEEAIRTIVDKIKEKRTVPDGFLASILRREELENTQFTYIAMPHTDAIISDQTLISVNILKKQIPWGDGPVQIVILMSFAKDFVKHNEDLFKFILEFIKDKALVTKLINTPSFAMLEQIITEVFRKEE